MQLMLPCRAVKRIVFGIRLPLTALDAKIYFLLEFKLFSDNLNLLKMLSISKQVIKNKIIGEG